MTKEEFASYIWDGPQRTPATLAACYMAQSGFVPTCDVETFEREIAKPDGVVPANHLSLIG